MQLCMSNRSCPSDPEPTGAVKPRLVELGAKPAATWSMGDTEGCIANFANAAESGAAVGQEAAGAGAPLGVRSFSAGGAFSHLCMI